MSTADQSTYLINEIFYGVQGEGTHYGRPFVFVRFAQCNKSCQFCDTEMESYTEMTTQQIVDRANQLWPDPVDQDHKVVDGARDRGGGTATFEPTRKVAFCGGEPLLQLDPELIQAFGGWYKLVETNGTITPPDGLDWIVCSPKIAEHAIMPDRVHELKYLRGVGQGIPRPRVQAEHYLISPIFDGDQPDPAAIAWCVRLVLEHPQWRLTVQHHKFSFGGVR